MGVKRSFYFSLVSFLIAFYCEYCSINYGVPFGYYTYHLDLEKNRELVIMGVPFFDTLSFVFLSYFSFTVAAFCFYPDDARKGSKDVRIPLLGGLLMTLLDFAIDPVTLKGEKFFLGHLYTYPYEGFYFGVTWENFVGWYFVGFFTQFMYQVMEKSIFQNKLPENTLHPLFKALIYGIYTSIFAFIVMIAFLI